MFGGTAGDDDDKSKGREGCEQQHDGQDPDEEGTATGHGLDLRADLEVEVVVQGVEVAVEVSWALSEHAAAAELVAAGVVAASLVCVDADTTVAADLPVGVEARATAPLRAWWCGSSVDGKDGEVGELRALGLSL
jgi:hypothetical protein